ncbi:MAG: molybdopterin-guanine dinucleotide biosynthesis protein B [Candidatus Electronema sp. V4]|uniref:molybdopterin-guanine dinucleotide biosynthesis protein B n=1 Tax=Candidatus Electronema sp. V4 TaxID=3454756 RepID=UPI00405580E7
MKPPVVTFIGWHSCGKTTLAAQVVRLLTERGWRAVVVKSTKDSGLFPDQPGTDTAIHRQAGAAVVALVAPDRLCITADNQAKDLAAIARRFFSDMDIVIGEGFKEAADVPKIEVFRGGGPRLRGQVSGVIAVASDCGLNEENSFGLHEHGRIADFIEEQFLLRQHP